MCGKIIFMYENKVRRTYLYTGQLHAHPSFFFNNVVIENMIFGIFKYC